MATCQIVLGRDGVLRAPDLYSAMPEGNLSWCQRLHSKKDRWNNNNFWRISINLHFYTPCSTFARVWKLQTKFVTEITDRMSNLANRSSKFCSFFHVSFGTVFSSVLTCSSTALWILSTKSFYFSSMCGKWNKVVTIFFLRFQICRVFFSLTQSSKDLRRTLPHSFIYHRCWWWKILQSELGWWVCWWSDG